MSFDMRSGHRAGTRGRAASAAVLLLVLGAVAAWFSACDDNPNTTLLTAPGGRGSIAGVLTFEGQPNPPLPQARILALQSVDCVSQYGAIAVLGTFNDFDIANVSQYLMDEIAPCYWIFADTLPKGQVELKFVTGNSPTTIAYDNPGDYGKTSANTGADPLEGTLDNPANGPDGNLSVTIPNTGVWNIILNEAVSPATYRITQEPLVIESDPRTGAFVIPDLPVGSYDVNIQVDGFLAKQLPGVEVLANRTHDLGTVTMEVASGKLYGTVAFAGDPDPKPEATVEVRRAGSAAVLQSVDTDSAYVFTGLDTGTYNVAFSAPGYLDTTLAGVQYDNGTEKDLGTVTLSAGCESQYQSIAIVGDFTGGFDPSAGSPMVQGPGCVWTDTVQVAAGGPYYFKFVTDGAFDHDYGGDESATFSLPGSYPVIPDVSGTGTAIKVSVAVTGQYVFVLDESKLTFTTTLLGGGPTGSVTGTVNFTGLNIGPYPKATVALYPSGSQTALATTTSDATTRKFTFQAVPSATYDLKVSANCFLPEQLTSVAVTGTAKDVGTVTLSPGTSAFTTIQIIGDFTPPQPGGWDPAAAPYMTESPACVWTDTLAIPAGEQYFKFLTDNTFDTPPDYGGNEAEILGIPGTYPVKPITGSNAIHIRVTSSGQFIITLDERRQTFSAVAYTPPSAPGAEQ